MDLSEIWHDINIKEKLKEIRTYIELYLVCYKINKPFLTKVKAALSRKPPYTLQIEEAENFLKLCKVHVKTIELLKETPELKEEPIVADFLEKNMPNMSSVKPLSDYDFDIILQDGKLKIISPEDADKILQKIKEEKVKELSDKVNVVHLKEAQGFYEYKNDEKVAPKGIVDIVNKLNVKHKSLLFLSAWVEKLYDEKRVDEVEETKSDIHKIYDQYGMKFCSLYTKGYLKSLLSKLYKQYQKDSSINIDSEISMFVSEKAKAIYFIHSYMDKNDVVRIVNQIDEYLRDKVEYIAIHSLGANVKKAKEIAKDISLPSKSDYTKKVIVPKKPYEFSIIWYRKEGIKIYSLITENENES